MSVEDLLNWSTFDQILVKKVWLPDCIIALCIAVMSY